MDDTGWSRAYWTVVALALILIPIGTWLASGTLTSTLRMCRRNQQNLPALTELMTSLNPWGLTGIAAGTLVVILALSLRRRTFDSVVISGLFLVLCAFLIAAALVACHLPFISGPIDAYVS